MGLGPTCTGNKEVEILATGEFFYRRNLKWQADSHTLAPTHGSNGNVSVPSWEKASLTAQQKVATKSLSTVLPNFTSLHNIYYYLEFFLFFSASLQPYPYLLPR